MTVQHDVGKSAKCETCKHNHDFILPDHLVEDLYAGNIVIFAGAGISTENKSVFPYTLYDDIRSELGISPETRVSFARLMSRFCAEPNGRRKLLEKIQERFQYIDAFPELNRIATQFHNEMSTLYFIDSIITTNWDVYFESECGAVPFVTADDFALWNVKGRKVFKIHGSINNYGSIIASESDYRKCYKNLRDGILGATIKHVLGTKTLIYIGYSFSDEDFLKLHRFLIREMGDILPDAYIVTLDQDSGTRFKKFGLTPIYTDATHFISILKRHAVETGMLLGDSRFDGIISALVKVKKEHDRLHESFNCKRHPEMIYAASYQDGLIHAFERMLSQKKTGHYSYGGNIGNTLHAYDNIMKNKIRRKRYHDVAYIEGYMNGLLFLLADDCERSGLPLYYIFGVRSQPQTFAEYRRISKKAQSLHKTSYNYAKRIVKRNISEDGELVLHHTPFLL